MSGKILEPRKLPERVQAANELIERLQRLVIPAKAGCPDAMGELWQALIPMAERIAKNTCHRYPFVDRDDLVNSMLLAVPKFVRRYDPSNVAGNSFSKYAYHRLFFTAKDVLRQRDDLGIMWPQKKQYPSFHHLGDLNMESFDAPDYRETGIDSLDDEQPVAADLADLKTAVAAAEAPLGEQPQLQPKPAAETPEQKAARVKERRRAANREWQRRNNAKRKAERAKAAAEKKAAAPAKPKGPDLVHKLQACKSLVAECGSLAAARESLELYASLV